MAPGGAKHFTFKRTDIWREGDWLDLWSVVHFLSGVSIGLGLAFLQFAPAVAIVATLIALIIYEWWEAYMQMHEVLTNSIMDVVVGMASFLPTFFFLGPRFAPPVLAEIFAGVFIANVSMATLGWRASHKAYVLEQRVKAQYALQRDRLRSQRKRYAQHIPRLHIPKRDDAPR